MVHTPVRASWLNQVEIYFGIVQRKVLTPAAAPELRELSARILAFEARARQQPRSFGWKFTRRQFHLLLHDLAGRSLTNFCRVPLSTLRARLPWFRPESGTLCPAHGRMEQLRPTILTVIGADSRSGGQSRLTSIVGHLGRMSRLLRWLSASERT